MRPTNDSCLALCCCLASLLIAAGCGDGRPARVPVSGSVEIDGQPLKYGYISFVPDNGRPSRSKLDAGGRFKLNCFDAHDGAILGRHRITVNAGESIDKTTTRWHAPKAYANLETSNLEQQIEDADTNLVISLTWNGGKPFVERHDEEAESVQ